MPCLAQSSPPPFLITTNAKRYLTLFQHLRGGKRGFTEGGMRILIVDENEPLAEITAELLRWIDRRARYIETITLACDLDTAIRLVANYDAVLCEGEFPISQDSLFLVEKWDAVRREALRCGIHFVLPFRLTEWCCSRPFAWKT